MLHYNLLIFNVLDWLNGLAISHDGRLSRFVKMGFVMVLAQWASAFGRNCIKYVICAVR